MPKNMTNTIKASTQSWARAHTLTKLAQTGTAHHARAFLAANKTTYNPHLLDGTPTKRNPAIRAIITEYQKFVKNGAKASEGDPTQAPRAGKQQTTTQRKTKGHKHKGLRSRKLPQLKRKGDKLVSLSLLKDLKTLASKHGGLEELTTGIHALKEISS